MQVTDVLGKALERSNALQLYWTFYATVTLGVLGFFGSKKRDAFLASVATVLLLAFMWANLGALRSVTKERLALQDLLVSALPAPFDTCDTPDCRLAKAIDPAGETSVIFLHAAGDAVVIAAIWTLAVRRTKDE